MRYLGLLPILAVLSCADEERQVTMPAAPAATAASSECRPSSERGAVARCLTSSVAGAVTYQAVKETMSASMRPVGLCKLVTTLTEAAGLYRVVSLTGVPEPQPAVPGIGAAHTYVELELIDAWTPNAPDVAVVRMPGGPTGTGATTTWLVPLTVGEEIGALLFTPPQNKGFYALNPLGVFKKNAAGGLTNGQLFTKTAASAADLRLKVWTIALASGGCPVDIAPDFQEAPAKGPPLPDQIYGGEGRNFPVED